MVMDVPRFGKNIKILKCKLCKKRFNSQHALNYHDDNAKVLCPVYKNMTMGEMIEHSKDKVK